MNPFYALEIIGVIFLSIILVNILTKWKKSNRALKAFAISLMFFILSCACDTIDSFRPQDEITVLYMLSYAFGCCTAAAPWWYLTYLINDEEGKEVIKAVNARIVTAVMSVCIVMMIICYASGTLIHYSEPDAMGNVIVEYGAPIMIVYAADLAAGIFMFVLIFLKRKQIKRSTMILVLLPIFLPYIGVIGEILIPGSILSLPTGTIGLFMQYLLLESHLVSDTEMKEKIMLDMANTDVLTSLRNRRSYSDFLDEHSEEIDAGAIFFDINNLKRTNDELGHFEGDKLITRCAALFKECLPNSTLFRISGDEFVALYVGKNDQQFFESEREAVRSALKENGSIASMGSSWGTNADLNDTIRDAEEAMYNDKNEYYLATGIERRK